MYGAEVELVDIAAVHCYSDGISVNSTHDFDSSQFVATRCEMSNNGHNGLYISTSRDYISFNVCLKNCISHHNSNGIYVDGKGVVNIHGDVTAVHSNDRCGIYAWDFGKIVLHLPSHHNTIYNNGSENRRVAVGATITNIDTHT